MGTPAHLVRQEDDGKATSSETLGDIWWHLFLGVKSPRGAENATVAGRETGLLCPAPPVHFLSVSSLTASPTAPFFPLPTRLFLLFVNSCSFLGSPLAQEPFPEPPPQAGSVATPLPLHSLGAPCTQQPSYLRCNPSTQNGQTDEAHICSALYSSSNLSFLNMVVPDF